MYMELKESLESKDPEIFNLIQQENKRQHEGLELIASENFTSKSVMECLGSVLTNKYSEGLPFSRYYGGNEVIDKIETLCINRALAAYRLDNKEWGVNVQPYSGSVANLAAFSAILNPHDRIMGLDLPSGGHLTHGYYTNKKKISSTSVFYESLPYHVNNQGYIDYDELEMLAKNFKPKLIICGASAYSRELDYARFRKIADINNSFLLCDMAHISGFVATGEMQSPFRYCDIVTTTTHKTLGGPRSGMIFFRKELEEKINFAVFPGLQGGPHEHQIAGVAHQLLEVTKPEFKQYIKQVKKNAIILANSLKEYDYDIVTGGTDNHLLLVDLRKYNITGSKVEKVCELCNISINKNSVPGDTSALSPGGIRIGTAALTARGFTELQFLKVAEYIDCCIKIAINIQSEKGKKLKDFVVGIQNNVDIITLREEIKRYSSQFPLYN